MPSNIPIGYGQATFSFTHEGLGKPLAVTLGIVLPGTYPSATELANELHTRFANTVMEDVDNSITCTHVDLFIGAGDDPSGSVRSNTPPKVGERAMVSAPLNTAVIVGKQGILLGRRGKGRLFMPGSCSSAEVGENGRLGESIVSSLNGTWQDFLDMLNDGVEGGWYDGPLFPCIIHKPPHEEQTPTRINAFVVSSLIGTRGSRIR